MVEKKKTVSPPLFLKLLDHVDRDGYFCYRKDFNRDFDWLKNIKTREQKLAYTMSHDFGIRELYVLYAVNVLRICDTRAIYRYLCVLKNQNKGLGFTVEQKAIQGAVSRLVQQGFLMSLQYVINSDTHLAEAYDLLTESRVSEFWNDLDVLEEDSVVDVDNMDDSSDVTIDGEAMMFKYNEADFKKLIIKSEQARAQKLTSANNTYRRNEFKKFYGKDAKVVALYSLDDFCYGMLSSAFGNIIVDKMAYKSLKGMEELLGIAACGYAASLLVCLNGFKKCRKGLVQSKRIGKFSIPVELQFDSSLKNGSIYRYYCAIFHAYNYDDEFRYIHGMAKEKAFSTVDKIRNYIGIMGLNKTGQDSVVVVLVNDGEDFFRFVGYMIEMRMTEAEFNRIYFTSDSVLNSLGVECMMQIKLDSSKPHGYDLQLAPFPIV